MAENTKMTNFWVVTPTMTKAKPIALMMDTTLANS